MRLSGVQRENMNVPKTSGMATAKALALQRLCEAGGFSPHAHFPLHSAVTACLPW